MIADLDRAIEQLLREELPIRNGEIDVKFDQPRREWSARLSRPTVNFFLYDVRENNTLRKHGWESLQQQNGKAAREYIAARKRLPFRIDCHYMLTTWATEPEDEHRLLSRTMLALLRHPTLPDQFKLGALNDQLFEIRSNLAQHDRLANPAEVWGALDNEIRPSVSFVVTLAFDPWAVVTGPMVRTVSLEAGQTDDMPAKDHLVRSTLQGKVRIGGVVTDASGEPQAGLQVALKGTGLFATTNDEGRFVLAGLSPGDHTLVVWPAEGNPVEQSITVPSERYDIEIA